MRTMWTKSEIFLRARIQLTVWKLGIVYTGIVKSVKVYMLWVTSMIQHRIYCYAILTDCRQLMFLSEAFKYQQEQGMDVFNTAISLF